MRHQNFDPALLKGSTGTFALLLAAVFATEFAVEELFSPLFLGMGPVAGGLANAGIVLAVLAAPVWYFLSRLCLGEASTSKSRAWLAVKVWTPVKAGTARST